MARIINVPGVGEAQVPDSATDADIVAFVRKVQEAGSVKAAYDKAIAERPGAIMSGIYGAGAALSAAGAAAAEGRFDPLANTLYGTAESLREESRKYVPEIGSFENIGGIGDAFTYAGEVAGQSLPYMAATALGGIGGFLVGGPVGAGAGATAVGLPLFTGENIIAQAEADKVPLRETDAGRAFTYAVPQTALDVASLGIGGKAIKLFRTASQQAQRGVARQIAAQLGKSAAAESLTETSQQALQILQADPDRLMEMDDATVSELLNAAVAGGVLGGVLGGGVEAYQTVRGQKAEQRSQDLKDIIQREADEGRGIDLRSETNLGVEELKVKKASPNLEIKPIKATVPDQDGNPVERDVYTIRDLGDKTKGKVNIGMFASEDAAKQAVAGYQSLIAQPSPLAPSATPPTAPAAPKTKIKTKITGEEKKAVQPPLPAEAPVPAPGLGKAVSELPKAPDTPVPEAPATFDKQREALQRGTRSALLYNATDKVPPKLINPQIKRIKLDDGRTIDFNRGKFNEQQVRDAVANNRLNEVLELGPFNKDEVLASEMRGNQPLAVVERTPDGVEVKAAAGTTETAPVQIAALEQTKTAPENIVATEPVQELVAKRIAGQEAASSKHDRFIEDLDFALVDLSPKPRLKAIAKSAIKAKVLTEEQLRSIDYLFADKDMTAEDIVPEIASFIEGNKPKKLSAAPAGGVSAEPASAVALLASRPEIADKFGDFAKKRLSALGLKNVGLRIETAVKTREFGRYARGAYDPATKVIEISLSSVDPAASDAEFMASLEETFNHEVIHAVVDLGVLTKAEFATLLQTAGTTKYPGSNFTYLDRAFATYSTMLKNPDGTVDRLAVSEEAVAEMFRDWNAGRLNVQEKPRGLFNRIREFFRRLRGAGKDAGLNKVFEEIKSGEIAARQPTVQTKSAAEKKLSVAPQLATSTQDRQNTAYSLFPYLRSLARRFFPDQPRLIRAGTKPETAAEDLANLDMLLARHPNTLASEQAFAEYMADVLGKAANSEKGVPLVPYNAVKMANDPGIIERQLRSLTPGQLSQAQDGFDGAADLRRAYQNGSATIEHTGKLLLWGILSRGVSPFVQESLFLDAVRGRGNVGGVNRFIEAAAKGEFNLEEYNEWLSLVIPEGSTGAGATHNLGAFGKTTLTKLQERLPSGQTVFERLHEIIADYSLSGKEARREFHKINSGIGINNKVISFMLLVSGRDDILVLDRVQMRNQFDDGRFEGYNLYDGEKIRTVNEDGTEGKAQTVTGTAIAGLGDGIMGLVYYEALERDLANSIRTAYAAVGRSNDFSLGRYHWESWVASSAQEVDHGTITGIINDALGQVDPYGLVTTGEGKYDTFMSGAKYGYTKDGQPYVALPDGLGNNYVFTPKDAKEVVKGYKKKKFGIIEDPDTFKVSESRTGAWYERPEINREALRDYLAGQIERKRNYVEPVSKPDEGKPDVYRPRLGRGRVGKVTPGKSASDIADKYIKKYSVPPAYNNVKQFTQEDVDKVVSGLNYGAGIQYIQGIVNSGVVKRFVPERFRPSERATSRFMQNWADKMIPVGEMIDYIRKNGGKVTDVMDAYMQEELMHGIVAEDLNSRENGLYKNLMDYLKSSGVKLKATEQEAARGEYGLEDYLYARHAKERNQRIRDIGNKDPEKGSGMTDAEADEILAAVNRSPNKTKILEAAKLFDKIIEDTNRVRIANGLTPDFSAMEVEDENGNKVIADMRVFKYYAPLRGFLEENLEYGANPEEELRVRTGSGLNVRGREDRQAMGRKSRASDIVAHAILQNSEAVIRAAKNRVGNSLIKLVEENPKQAEEFGVKILKKAPTRAIINKNGVIQTMVDPMFKQRPDILIVKAMPDVAKGLKGGEQVIIEVSNEALQKALISKKVAGSAMAEKILSTAQWVNRMVAMVNTGINPEFMLTNFPRDLQTALVNIEQYKTPGIRKKIMKDVMPAMRGAWNVIRNPDAKGFWEDAFRDFKQQGGMTSGIAGVRGIEERIRTIGNMVKDPSGSYQGRAVQAGKNLVGFLEDMNSAVENAIRLSVYKNLSDNGFTKQRAAQASKNLTVNFDKRGEYGSTFNALYLFFNASVQGTLAMGIAAARSPRVRKIIGGIIILGLVQDIINSMLSPEDKDGKNIYDKIPDYKLRTNLIIMEPFGITERGYLSIPLPYGYNAFFNMGRSLSRKLRGEYSTTETTNNIVGTFVDAFNPIGGTENLLNAISPTVVDPVVSLYLNQDFTGRKIYPEAFPGAVPKSDSNTYWTSTSPIFKSLTQFLNSATGGSEYVPGMIDLSPDVIQYLFEYATGGAGAFALRTLDTPANVIIPALKGDFDEIELNNVPVFRKLFGNVSDRVITEGYMQNANYLLARGKELDAAIKSGDVERIKETRERYKNEIRVYPRVKSLVNRRNKIASDLRKLRENPRIPEEQKRNRIDQMQKQIVQITAEVNKIYEEVAGDKFPGIL